MIQLAAVLLLSLPVRAAPASSTAAKPGPVFPKTAFALPVIDGLRMDWVLAPMDKKPGAKGGSSRSRFDVDPSGNPWFGEGPRRILMSPTKKAYFYTAGAYDDYVFLDDGTQLVCTDRYLGTPFFGRAGAKKENGLPVVPLRALAKLDGKGCRLYSGGAGAVYIVARRTAGKGDRVTVLRSGREAAPKAENLLASDARITALAGDGRATFFAAGEWIYEVLPGEAKPRPYYTPKETVTGLAYSPDAGLFYATTGRVGFASPEFQMNFLTSPDPQIALRGGALYVRLSRTMAVVKISGAKLFKTLRWR